LPWTLQQETLKIKIRINRH